VAIGDILKKQINISVIKKTMAQGMSNCLNNTSSQMRK